jgi:hypothetical protein
LDTQIKLSIQTISWKKHKSFGGWFSPSEGLQDQCFNELIG